MRAVVSRAPGQLVVEDVAEPKPAQGQAVLRVLACGICGSDLHLHQHGMLPPGAIMGHEFCGEVVEAAGGLKTGERVCAIPNLSCGVCERCRSGLGAYCATQVPIGLGAPNGAFAEYLCIPAANVWAADPAIPLDQLAYFDPFGNATHTALSFDLVGEDVLITGAGPIGCMAAAIARHCGARHIVVSDPSEYRRNLARKMGATLTVNPLEQKLEDAQKELHMHEGFDVGMEMSGHADGFRAMLANMAHGGRIALLGIFPSAVSIDWDQVIFKGLIIKGIYGREMYETWYKMTVMLQSGLNISPVITHRFHYSEFQQGFDAMISGQSGKVILTWNEG